MNATEYLIHEARVYADGMEWGHITTPRILRGLADALEKATAPLSGNAAVDFLSGFEQVAFEKCRYGAWEDWDALDPETRDRLRTTYGEWTAKLATALGVEITFEKDPDPDEEPRYFRRPYMVEWTRRLYSAMGQTDPQSETFATREEAIVFWHNQTMDGYDAHVFTRDPATGDWDY